MSKTFYGWIPTNKGKLEIDFIGRQKFLNHYIINENNVEQNDYIYKVEVNLNFMNDAFLFNAYSKNPIEYVETIAKLNIKKDLTGNITYSNSNDEIEVSFKIENNGKIEFDNYKQNDDNFDSKSIQQSMFVLAKLFIHRDNHHHQKIDTALRVYDTFDELKISNDILSHIKILENNVKRNNKCESQLKNYNALEEAKGYIAYLKTFKVLFEKEKNLKKILKISKNILLSMKSNIKKRKNKANNIQGLYSALFTFIGLFITINLLFNGFYKNIDISIYVNRVDILIYTFLTILFLFFMYIRCKLHAFIYYRFYEVFDILFFVKYSKLENLNYKGKAIKFIPIFILMTIIIPYYIMQ